MLRSQQLYGRYPDRSPRASLASDLYDLSLAMDVENGEGPGSGKEEHPGESSVARGEAAEEILSFLSG